MKTTTHRKHTYCIALAWLLFSPLAHPVEIDLNSATVVDQGNGSFLYSWPLSGTGITQLEPGERYVIDVEFMTGQLFNVLPNLVGSEVLDLSFGSNNGPASIDPGLVQLSGSLEISGLVGDLSVSNPTPLDPLIFLGNFAGGDTDFVVPNVIGDLTSEGFSFHGLRFDFTLDNQGAIFPVDTVALVAIGGSQAVPATADLWDISEGAVITSHSPVLAQSDIRNLFGGAFGTIPFGAFTSGFFQDGLPAGTVHSVEWQTTAPIELTSFNLFANHDADMSQRGFSRFSLFAQNPTTSNFELLAEVFPSDPYGDTPGNMYSGSSLGLSIDVTPTVARVFRAEFVQAGDIGDGALAPRIGELDGIGFRLECPGSVCRDSFFRGWRVILAVPPEN